MCSAFGLVHRHPAVPSCGGRLCAQPLRWCIDALHDGAPCLPQGGQVRGWHSVVSSGVLRRGHHRGGMMASSGVIPGARGGRTPPTAEARHQTTHGQASWAGLEGAGALQPIGGALPHLLEGVCNPLMGGGTMFRLVPNRESGGGEFLLLGKRGVAWLRPDCGGNLCAQASGWCIATLRSHLVVVVIVLSLCAGALMPCRIVRFVCLRVDRCGAGPDCGGCHCAQPSCWCIDTLRSHLVVVVFVHSLRADAWMP